MIICVLKSPINSSLLFAAALSFNGRIAVREAQRARKKNISDTPHNDVKCVLSIKESNFNGKNGSKFSNLITVRAEGADPPIPLPYGQRDRKYPFSTPSLRNTHRSKSLLKTCFNVYYVKIANLIRKTGNQNYWHFSLLVPFGRGLELMWRTLA